MTKSNSSATLSTSNLYEHPWFTQLKLLDNTMTCESQSQPKPKSETPGQKSTSYCYLCKQNLPINKFYKNRHRRCGVQRQCKTCQQKYYRLKKEHSIPENQICELCNEQPASHWDHTHDTDEHRGWLCGECNTGIGMFKENISLFYKAITYLSTTTNGNQI